MEQHVNKLPLKCTDFNSSTRATVYAEFRMEIICNQYGGKLVTLNTENINFFNHSIINIHSCILTCVLTPINYAENRKAWRTKTPKINAAGVPYTQQQTPWRTYVQFRRQDSVLRNAVKVSGIRVSVGVGCVKSVRRDWLCRGTHSWRSSCA